MIFVVLQKGKKMSMINEMVERLRSLARVNTDDTFRLLWGAANTIEALSEKVREQNFSADRPTDEEEQLKFYYVESIDDYWIGMRIDNFYYADWHEGIGFVWSHSRYLPWGEHIVDENTLWKEHTYPSEPIEVPFTEWIVGFVQKYFAGGKGGRGRMSEKPIVFNYNDYLKLKEENEKLRQENTNLRIRMRIEEEDKRQEREKC